MGFVVGALELHSATMAMLGLAWDAVRRRRGEEKQRAGLVVAAGRTLG